MTERLICAKIGSQWQVAKRINAFWSVGEFCTDLQDAIRSAEEKFESDHRQLLPVAPPPFSTDLSDLLFN